MGNRLLRIRAKLPQVSVSQSAIWMLFFTRKLWSAKRYRIMAKLWDIMEHVGFDQNHIHGNIHTKAFNHVLKTNKGGGHIIDRCFQQHFIPIFGGMDRQLHVSIGVDGKEYFLRFNTKNQAIPGSSGLMINLFI